MTNAARRAAKIEFEAHSDPISGTITHSEREPQPFTGWLELLSALAAAHTNAADSHDPVELRAADAQPATPPAAAGPNDPRADTHPRCDSGTHA